MSINKEQNTVLSECDIKIMKNTTNNLLNKIKLSYETTIHKKVYDSDCFMTIPQGIKTFTLFFYYKENYYCIIKKNNQEDELLDIFLLEKNIQIVHEDFILYGTIFTYQNTNFFNIEDLLYYNKDERKSYSLIDNFICIKTILDSKILSNAVSTKNKLKLYFGLPVLSPTFSDIIYKTYLLPYDISYIQCRHLHKKNNKKYLNIPYIKNKKNTTTNAGTTNAGTINAGTTNAGTTNAGTTNAGITNAGITNAGITNNGITNAGITNNGTTNNVKNNRTKILNNMCTVIFEIKAEIQNDIYSLYVNKNGVKTWYGYACIPDCKTSIFMNKLFRNIKENEDLDYLEESDTEEDFENTNIDKYVLNKTYNIICEYNKTFNKWKPIRVSERNNETNKENEIISYKQLIFIENNKK